MRRCNFLPTYSLLELSWGWYLQLSCKTGLCSSKFFQEFLSFLSLYIGWNVLIISEVLPSVRAEKGGKVFVSLLMIHDPFLLKGGKASDLSQGCRWKLLMLGTMSWSTCIYVELLKLVLHDTFYQNCSVMADQLSVFRLQSEVWSLWKFLLNSALLEDIRH